MTHEIDLENCRECEESRCILSTYYNKSLEEIEYTKEVKEAEKERIKEVKELKKFKEHERLQYNAKIKTYYLKETKYWTKFKDREMSMIKPDKDGHYNVKNSDTTRRNWMHDSNWFIGIQQLMELQDKYYNSIKY